MLNIQNLTYRVAGRVLLDKTSVNISAGHRVGLVGPNGAGKTTLFKLITGEITPDDGQITLLRGASLGIVSQHVDDDERSLVQIVLDADTERAALLAEAETATDGERIGEIYERLMAIGAYDAPARAATILSGLGFDAAAQEKSLSDFSGGWRARVALAAALFRQPNLLLLDEPTNHLDVESILWLEGFLARYQGTLIIISHDRDILNKTVTQILHLDQCKLISYTGSYDDFERRRAERLLNQQALYEKQQAQRAHMQSFVDRFRAKASKARQAQSRLKALERMDVVDAVLADRTTRFTFPQPDNLRSPLVRLENVKVGYGDKAILNKLNLRIDQDDRIALLGSNGNGKSTLVKLLAGKIAPMGGEKFTTSKLKVGYFAQFQTDEMDVTQTAYQTLQEVMRDKPEHNIRAQLGQFGFDKQKADTKVGELSGGEKARLLFCRMSHAAPQLMLLDEPTNHLDIEARTGLMSALNNYNGAVILVSHDTHLLSAVADQLWLVEGGTCRDYDGDVESYRDYVLAQRRADQRAPQASKAAKVKVAPAEAPNRSVIEKQAQKLEQQIIELKQQHEQLTQKLAESYAQANGPAAPQINSNKLQSDYAEVVAALAAAEAEWLSLAEKL